MAISQQEIYDEYYKQGEKDKNELINAKKDTAKSDEETIKAYADASVQAITDGYNADVAETTESYESAFRENDIQVKLNERYLERKAAEMGLTDSGMNRTQMTANQISYANQKGALTAQKQKAIDTLAATMRSKITEVETKRDDSLAQVKSNLNNDIAQINADYSSSVREQAAETYNTIYKTEAEEASKYNYVYNDKGEVVGKYTDDERENAWNNLCTLFDEGENVDLNNAKTLISDFAKTYGASEVEQQILYNKAVASHNKTSQNTGNEEQRKQAFSDLNSVFDANAVSDPNIAAGMICEFSNKYGITDAERFLLLNKAGITPEEYDAYLDSDQDSMFITPEEYNSAVAPPGYDNKDGTEYVAYTGENKPTGRLSKEWSGSLGSLNYVFKIVTDTKNRGLGDDKGVDNNDVVTIYYPDGETVVAENVQIKDLPKGIRQTITNMAHENEGKSFVYSCDLSDLN